MQFRHRFEKKMDGAPLREIMLLKRVQQFPLYFVFSVESLAIGLFLRYIMHTFISFRALLNGTKNVNLPTFKLLPPWHGRKWWLCQIAVSFDLFPTNARTHIVHNVLMILGQYRLVRAVLTFSILRCPLPAMLSSWYCKASLRRTWGNAIGNVTTFYGLYLQRLW